MIISNPFLATSNMLPFHVEQFQSQQNIFAAFQVKVICCTEHIFIVGCMPEPRFHLLPVFHLPKCVIGQQVMQDITP